MSEELKKCPFCGGEADLMTDELGDSNSGTVMCMSCFAVSNTHDNWRDAILAWNTRTEPKPPSADVQEALDALLDMANRLQLLDGPYSWDIEVETIKTALERMGAE